MTVINSAIKEMALLGFSEEDMNTMRKILELFFNQWDSGGAVWVMSDVLTRCVKGIPLSPLTGEESEWMIVHSEDGLYQNVRCFSVFKKNGECWDIDNKEWDGTFPYLPKNRNIDPVVTFG